MKFDFSKNQTVDDINTVPEDFRGLYKDNGAGEHELRSDDPGVRSAISAITRMSGALNKARNDVKALEGKTGNTVDLSSLSEYGETVDEIAETINSKMSELNAKLEGAKNKKDADEVQRQIDKIRDDLMGTHKKEIDAKEAVIAKLRGSLDTTLATEGLTRAIVAEGGDPELLMPHLRPFVKTVETETGYATRVVDADGEVRFSGSTGAEMDPGELVKEFKSKEKFGRMFNSEAPSGGGAGPTRKSPATPPTKDLSANEKIAAGLRKGQAGHASGKDRAGAGVH